jgi:hypothetical protein
MLLRGTTSKSLVGDVLAIKCPSCGGPLSADKQFHSHWQADLDEDSLDFWSTTCRDCSRRFNYVPATGQLAQIESTT